MVYFLSFLVLSCLVSLSISFFNISIFSAGRHYNRALDCISGRKRKTSPVDKIGSQKFKGKNSFFGSCFPNSVSQFTSNIPESSINKSVSAHLSSILKMGLSDSTWGKYRTSLNHLNRIQESTGVDMSLPLDDNKLLWFISFLSSQRNLDSKTIDGYLSGSAPFKC